MYAQPVQNTSLANTAVRDITLAYTAADLKSCHILNIWLVEVQVGTSQAIRHGIGSRKVLNGIAAIPLRIVLSLTLQVRSDLKRCSSRILLALPNSQTTMVQHKLEELRVLLGKFSSPQDAHKILEWANITLRQGDESFLNNKLEQLRMLDRQGW